MDQQEFLRHLIGDRPGFLCLGRVDDRGGVEPKWVPYPSPVPYNDPGWPYFLPAVFQDPLAKGFTRSVNANADEQESVTGQITPSITTATSEKRVDLSWLLDEEIAFDEAQVLSRRLVPAGDPSPYIRLPGIPNQKYKNKYIVGVVRAPLITYSTGVLRRLPDPNGTALKEIPTWDWQPKGMGPLEFAKTLRDKSILPANLAARLDGPGANFDQLVESMIQVDIPVEEMVYLLKNAKSNPYAGMDEVGRETAKTLARKLLGRLTVNTQLIELDRIRRSRAGPAFVRRNRMTSIAEEELKKTGRFMHTTDNEPLYVDQQNGQVVELTPHSEKLRQILVSRLGINPVDTEHRHIAYSLIATAQSLPPTSTMTDISWYDSQSNVLSIYLGGDRVMRMSRQEISESYNGDNGLVFRLPPKFEPVVSSLLDFQSDYSGWWEQFCPPLQNLVGMTPAQASALLRVWTTFVFFQSSASARPLLVFLGNHGCLAGDTPLELSRGGHTGHRKYTIAEAYHLMHGGARTGKGRNWQDVETRIFSEKNGVVKNRKIHDIVFSGEKMTYTISIEGHTAFRATADHRFLTPEGYKPLSALQPGDEVITHQAHTPLKKRTFKHRRTVKARFHPRARQRVVGWETLDGEEKSRLYPSIPYAWAVVEADMNGLSTEEFLEVVQNDEERAAELIYMPWGWTVHHKDEDPTNDVLENLQALSKLDHDTMHNQAENRRRGNSHELSTSTVVSITPYKVEPTYDVIMDDEEAPNFSVEGVIVHNSGKSTMATSIYRLLYGVQMGLIKIGSAMSFDTAISHHAVAFFDNVDTAQPWLNEKLATSISRSSDERKKLYTDNDLFSVTNRALVGITSRNPPFLQEDIIDRMLYFTFLRYEDMKIPLIPETEIYSKITANRHIFMSGLLQDARRVLQTPKPVAAGITWRIADFVSIGLWIASALGIEKDFMDGIASLKKQQRGLTIEADHDLVQALEFYSERCKTVSLWKRVADLWEDVILFNSEDTQRALRAKYKTPALFGRKLFALYGTLKTVLPGLEYKLNEDTTFREWRIVKEEV